MKRLSLILLVLLFTIPAVLADNRPTRAENEAAMKAGRSLLTAKTAELESNINSRNNQLAQVSSASVLDLMRKGMAQKSIELNLESPDKQAELNKHYLEMERITHEYQRLSQNVSANGPQLIRNAQAFLKKY